MEQLTKEIAMVTNTEIVFESNEVESVRFRFNKENRNGWIVEHNEIPHYVDEVVSHIGFKTKSIEFTKTEMICGKATEVTAYKYVAESNGKLSILKDMKTGHTRAIIYI